VFALLIVVPLAAGMLLNGRWPGAAPRLAKIIGLVGVVAFIGFSITAKDARAEALKSMGTEGAVAMLLFIVACMAAGWIMGGRRREVRQMLATATSMRNTAFCLVIARDTASGVIVMPALVAFSLLMVPPNALLTLYGTIRTRRSAARATEGGQARAS
jgi:BASS family bile acid:Na+ symporter